MKPGDIKKFAIEKGSHICKVEIMEIRKTNLKVSGTLNELSGKNVKMMGRDNVTRIYDAIETKLYFVCRRLDNGGVILAWPDNLT